MGNLSRLSSDNDSFVAFDEGPWAPSNPIVALAASTAIRCCTCRRVVVDKHVTIKGDHVFCPDHQEEALCSDPCNYARHHNVCEFIQKQQKGFWGSSFCGSSDASDAD